MEYRIPNHSVCLTTNKSNKFSVTVFGERLKQAKWQRNSDLNTVEQPVQPEMRKKTENDNLFYFSYFLGKNVFDGDGFKNMFVYQ